MLSHVVPDKYQISKNRGFSTNLWHYDLLYICRTGMMCMVGMMLTRDRYKSHLRPKEIERHLAAYSTSIYTEVPRSSMASAYEDPVVLNN